MIDIAGLKQTIDCRKLVEAGLVKAEHKHHREHGPEVSIFHLFDPQSCSASALELKTWHGH